MSKKAQEHVWSMFGACLPLCDITTNNTQQALLRRAQCKRCPTGISRGISEKDIFWMASYVVPKPVRTLITYATGTNTPPTQTPHRCWLLDFCLDNNLYGVFHPIEMWTRQAEGLFSTLHPVHLKRAQARRSRQDFWMSMICGLHFTWYLLLT